MADLIFHLEIYKHNLHRSLFPFFIDLHYLYHLLFIIRLIKKNNLHYSHPLLMHLYYIRIIFDEMHGLIKSIKTTLNVKPKKNFFFVW